MTSAIQSNSASFDQAMFLAKNQNIGKTIDINISDKEKIKKTAKEFEAVFLSEMMSHMFDRVEVNDTFGGGHGEEMFRSMITKEYGKQMADRGGIGLANHVSEQMIRLQEMKSQGLTD